MDKKIFESSEAFHAELARVEKEPLPEEGTDGEVPEPEEEDPAAEPEPEQEPQGDPDEDDGEEDDDDFIESDKGKVIPKSRYDKAKAKRIEAEKIAEQAKIDVALAKKELDDYKKTLELMFENGKKPESESDDDDHLVLDPETDARTQKQIKELKEEHQKLKDENLKQAAQAAFKSDLVAQESEYMKDNPDFRDALEHVYKVELEKAKLINEEGVAQQVASAIMTTVAAKAWKDGKNVADTMYKLAKTLGYAKKAAATGGKPDLKAIEDNMKKSKSVGEMANGNATMAGDDFTKPENFAKLKGKHGEIDKTKFHELLKKVQAKQV